MARRRNSSNSALGGCGSIGVFIIVGIASLLEWIQQNPALTIIIIVGIITIILLIIAMFKSPNQNNYQQYNQNYNQNYNRYNYNNQNNYQQSYNDDIDIVEPYSDQNARYNRYNSDNENNYRKNYNEDKEEQYSDNSYSTSESTTNNDDKSSFIVEIATCTEEEILSLDGFNEEKAKRFIEERNNGKIWYDIDSFAQDFELQPHEMIMIQDRIKFPNKPQHKYGRKLDI